MEILQQGVNGLTLGAIYALIALGYTLVYGVLRLINFAHGDVYMLGAYSGLFAAGALGITKRLDEADALALTDPLAPATGNPLVNVLEVGAVFFIAMLACALIGALIERFAYRPLRSAPRLTVLITAIGVSLLIEYGGQAGFSPDPRGFPKLVPSRDIINTGNASISFQAVVIIGTALALMVALQFIVTKTRLGRAMRAVSLDRGAASLMGINTDTIIAFTFALGSALAAAAGGLSAVYQSSVDPLMGLTVGLKAFVAAVLGGIGSIPGAVLGGLLMGLAETAVKSQPALSPYSDAIAFMILIAVLIVRPAGLLGRNVAEKV